MKGHPPLELKYFSLGDLKEKYDKNEIFINPDYQRGFIWKPKEQKLLITSIMDESPIGSLIVWQNQQKQLEILDGQQRIKTILAYLQNELEDANGKIFHKLSKTQRDFITGYNIPYLQINSTSPGDISAIFVRLQEGRPLTIAEKVHAFVGKFKDEYVKIFAQNYPFFSRYSNKRLKSLFLSAQFLAIELKTNFHKKIFHNFT